MAWLAIGLSFSACGRGEKASSDPLPSGVKFTSADSKAKSVSLFPKFIEKKMGNPGPVIATGKVTLNSQIHQTGSDITAGSGNSFLSTQSSVTTKLGASTNSIPPQAASLATNPTAAAPRDVVSFGTQNTVSQNIPNSNFSTPSFADTPKTLSAAPSVNSNIPVIPTAPVFTRSAANTAANTGTVSSTPTLTASNQVALNPTSVATSNSSSENSFRSIAPSLDVPTGAFNPGSVPAPAPVVKEAAPPAPSFAKIAPISNVPTGVFNAPTTTVPAPPPAPAPETKVPAPAPVLNVPPPEPLAQSPKLPPPTIPLVIPPPAPESKTGDASQASGGTSTDSGSTGTSAKEPAPPNSEAPPPPPAGTTSNENQGGAGADALVGTYASNYLTQATGVAAPLPVLEIPGKFSHAELTIERVPAAYGERDPYFKVGLQIVTKDGETDPTDHSGSAIRVFDHYKNAFRDFYIQAGNRAEFTWNDEPAYYAPGTKRPLWVFFVLPRNAPSSALSFEPKMCPEWGCLPDPAWLQLAIVEKPSYLLSAEARISDAFTVTGGKTWISTITEEPVQNSVLIEAVPREFSTQSLTTTINKTFLFNDDDPSN